MDVVWLKVAQLLGELNGENTKRDNYVKIPEYEIALTSWKAKERAWEEFQQSLSECEKKQLEEYLELQENLASAQEKRAYIQGYVDCVQILFHIGLLKEKENLNGLKLFDT